MVEGLSADQLAHLIQFQHPGKVLARLGGPPLAEARAAEILGIDPALYRRVRGRSAQIVAETARAILEDGALAAAVDRLPFLPGATVVGLGDSITDDDQSWLEILRQVLALRRPGDGIRVLNAGISADTSAQILARFIDVAHAEPDWIIALAGTNDARRHGYPEAEPMASLAETDRTLRALRRVAARTGARWVWITPPPVIEDQVVADWLLGALEISYRNADLAAIAALIRGYPDPAIDLWPAFGEQADRALFLSDGLHPSLAGQVAIARALIRGLS